MKREKMTPWMTDSKTVPQKIVLVRMFYVAYFGFFLFIESNVCIRICSIIALISLFCYGVAEGDPTKLVEVFDVDSKDLSFINNLGNRCGKTSGFEDYKYLYYMVPLPNYLYRGICVKEVINNLSLLIIIIVSSMAIRISKSQYN